LFSAFGLDDALVSYLLCVREESRQMTYERESRERKRDVITSAQ